MKICFIADANSIHARRWIEYFCKAGNEIHVLSSTRNPGPLEYATVYDLYTGKIVVPTTRSTTGQTNQSVLSFLKRPLSYWIRSSSGLTRFVERFTYIYQTMRLVGKARAIVKELQPDLLHCLRFPIEGYIGGLIGYRPLIISSWGNDFVFFANRYVSCRWLTKKAIRQVDAYLADTTRDRYISVMYGFSPSKPTLTLPVIGGLKLDEFPPYRKPKDKLSRERMGVSTDTNLLIMTRDFKSPYANTEALVRAMPQVIEALPNTFLIMVGNLDSPGYFQLKELAEKLGIGEYVRFSGWLAYNDFVEHVAASDIMVSVGLYDGCPASMLEGMACGAVPVMSNDFPIQEWITDGWNGYLFDPRDVESIARTIIRALKNKDSFETFRQRNWDLLAERADYHKNMETVEDLYLQIIERNSTQQG